MMNLNQFLRARHSFLVLVFSIGLVSCSSQPELPKLSPQGVILAFGDSLTYGTGAKRDQAYPAILEGLSGHHVVNAGIPGEVTKRGLERLPEVLDDTMPELMILCHGGNDLIRKMGEQAAANNLRQMVTLAKQQGISVILVAVPKPSIMLEEPEYYKQVAEEFGIPILEGVLPGILRKPSMKSDVIHPNAEGYKVMAEQLHELLSEVGSI